MPKYTAYVTYTIDDEVEIEAESLAQAYEKAWGMDVTMMPYSTEDGHAMSWDDVNVYEVIENEE